MPGLIYGLRTSLGTRVATHGTGVVATPVITESRAMMPLDVWDCSIEEADNLMKAIYHIALCGNVVFAQVGGLEGYIPVMGRNVYVIRPTPKYLSQLG